MSLSMSSKIRCRSEKRPRNLPRSTARLRPALRRQIEPEARNSIAAPPTAASELQAPASVIHDRIDVRTQFALQRLFNSPRAEERKHAIGLVPPKPTISAVAAGRVQAKLEVGEPDDRFEREADRVAEQVLRMPGSAVAGDAEASSSPPRVQRLCDGCAHEEQEEIQRKCAECEAEEETVQRQRAASRQPPTVTPALASDLARLRHKGGRPLAASARAFFEPRFGHDFSTVRVHAGDDAAALAQQLKARAFTVGNDVFFSQGEYQPQTERGRRLLAHELTHTVQQTGSVLHRAPLGGADFAVERGRQELTRAVSEQLSDELLAPLFGFGGLPEDPIERELVLSAFTSRELSCLLTASSAADVGSCIDPASAVPPATKCGDELLGLLPGTRQVTGTEIASAPDLESVADARRATSVQATTRILPIISRGALLAPPTKKGEKRQEARKRLTRDSKGREAKFPVAKARSRLRSGESGRVTEDLRLASGRINKKVLRKSVAAQLPPAEVELATALRQFELFRETVPADLRQTAAFATIRNRALKARDVLRLLRRAECSLEERTDATRTALGEDDVGFALAPGTELEEDVSFDVTLAKGEDPIRLAGGTNALLTRLFGLRVTRAGARKPRGLDTAAAVDASSLSAQVKTAAKFAAEALASQEGIPGSVQTRDVPITFGPGFISGEGNQMRDVLRRAKAIDPANFEATLGRFGVDISGGKDPTLTVVVPPDELRTDQPRLEVAAGTVLQDLDAELFMSNDPILLAALAAAGDTLPFAEAQLSRNIEKTFGGVDDERAKVTRGASTRDEEIALLAGAMVARIAGIRTFQRIFLNSDPPVKKLCGLKKRQWQSLRKAGTPFFVANRKSDLC